MESGYNFNRESDQLDVAFTIVRRAIEEMRAAGCNESTIAEVLEHSMPACELANPPVPPSDDDWPFGD